MNLVKGWRPSAFVGLYLLPYDHRQAPLARDTGGDFALILDVERSPTFDGDTFTAHPLFAALRTRLREDAGGWDFADHLAQASPNRWHPLHLRRPLAELYRGTRTAEERRGRWLAAARDATEVLLRGGELAQLRRAFGR